jgi:hypothetical protein
MLTSTKSGRSRRLLRRRCGRAAHLAGENRLGALLMWKSLESEKSVFQKSGIFSFRREGYNTMNHRNLGIPNTQWCLPPHADGSTDLVRAFGCQFGKITNVQTDRRAMQLGLKFAF